MAITWEHDLRAAVTESVAEDGQTQFIFNPQILDYHLQTISTLSRDKGVHIESDEDRTEIETKLKQLITILEIVREAHEDDQDALVRTAYAYALGFNMAFPDAEEKALELYQLAHSKTPDEPLINFLLGMFMFGTEKHHLKCKPYLEVALEKGVESCRFTLGMLYIRENDNEKGKAYLKQYAEDNPDNKHAQLVWEAVERGALNFEEKNAAKEPAEV